MDEKVALYKNAAIPGRVLSIFGEEKNDGQGRYCCELMKMFLADPRIPLFYSLVYREYYVPLLYKKKSVMTAMQCLFYCPWCSEKLPKSVRSKWFDILNEEYNIDDPDSEEQEKLIPAEFKTDEWWKRRKL